MKDLIEARQKISANGFMYEVSVYYKLIGVKRFDTGLISGYEVLQIFEVESYLKGENPVSSKLKTFGVNSVPKEVVFHYNSQQQGLI